jgi:hypothetical protein
MADSIHQFARTSWRLFGAASRAITGVYPSTTQTTRPCVVELAVVTNSGAESTATMVVTLLDSGGSAAQYVALVAGASSTTHIPGPIYAPYGFQVRTLQGANAVTSAMVSWKEADDAA